MSELFDYVRVYLFDTFPKNITLSSEYMSEEEVLNFFRSHFESKLDVYGVADRLPLVEYTSDLFDELFDNDLVSSFEDPLAGEYFWPNLKKISSYMLEELSRSDIYARKIKLKDDRLYEAVFDRLKDGEIDASFRDDDDLIRGEKTLTVKSYLSETERAEFVSYLAPMREEIENANITQEQRVDALAALDAIDKLSEAPNPLWQVIALILSSPILANVTALAALAISILKP